MQPRLLAVADEAAAGCVHSVMSVGGLREPGGVAPGRPREVRGIQCFAQRQDIVIHDGEHRVGGHGQQHAWRCLTQPQQDGFVSFSQVVIQNRDQEVGAQRAGCKRQRAGDRRVIEAGDGRAVGGGVMHREWSAG